MDNDEFQRREQGRKSLSDYYLVVPKVGSFSADAYLPNMSR